MANVSIKFDAGEQMTFHNIPSDIAEEIYDMLDHYQVNVVYDELKRKIKNLKERYPWLE